MKMFVENCANSYNATLGHNWFLNIANYLHERKNMNIKIMDSRNKICCPICFLYIYSLFSFSYKPIYQTKRNEETAEDATEDDVKRTLKHWVACKGSQSVPYGHEDKKHSH